MPILRGTMPQTDGRLFQVSRSSAELDPDITLNNTMHTTQTSRGDGRGSTKLRKTSLTHSISPSAPAKPSAHNHNQSPSHSALWSNPAPFHERAVSTAESRPSLSDDSFDCAYRRRGIGSRDSGRERSKRPCAYQD